MRFNLNLLSLLSLSLVIAGALIFVADYYSSPGLLIVQLLAIGLPIFVPFALLSGTTGGIRALGIVVVGAILAAGWGYVAYLDTRPYGGGGASLALLSGWTTSVIAALIASLFRVAEERK